MNPSFTPFKRVRHLLAAVLTLTAASGTTIADPPRPGIFAQFVTTRGPFVAWLDSENVPLTVANFIGLAEGTKHYAAKGSNEKPKAQNKPYYDGTPIQRLQGPFTMLTGASKNDGNGGPGYTVPSENNGRLTHSVAGVLSMVPEDDGGTGSRFIITSMPTPWLDKRNTAFGRVVSGLGAALSLTTKDRVLSITILRNGPEASAFKADEEHFRKLLKGRSAKSTAGEQ